MKRNRFVLLVVLIAVLLTGCVDATGNIQSLSSALSSIAQNKDARNQVITSAIGDIKLVQVNNTWSYASTGSDDEDEYLEALFAFLHQEYAEIFDTEIIDGIPCVIYNDKDTDCPMTRFLADDLLAIRLHLSGLNYWCQLVYQLSHEMTHYVFCQTYDYMVIEGSSWNEEIVCEAMSLYMLRQLADKWEDCSLFEYNRGYSSGIYEYVDDMYREYNLRELKSSGAPMPVREYQALNDSAASNRENHEAESLYLYDVFREIDSKQITPVILDMYKYLSDDGYIDYKQWSDEADDPEVISKFSKIQPVIR